MSIRRDLLAVYLNDHLAGSSGGSALAHRLEANHRKTAFGPELARFAADIEQDQDALVAIMARLDIPRNRIKGLLAAVGERVGRLKLNGRIFGRSPLSTVTELELMRIGVQGKLSGWRSLRELVADEPRLDADELDELIGRAEDQSRLLEGLRVRAVAESLIG
jgi:hypothetical protein